MRREATLRRQARAIFKAALRAANPAAGVTHALAGEDFSRYRNIYVVGAGKAGAAMARAAERVLGRRITRGLLNVKYGYVARLRRIELNECGHPLPDHAAWMDRAASPKSQPPPGRTIWCCA